MQYFGQNERQFEYQNEQCVRVNQSKQINLKLSYKQIIYFQIKMEKKLVIMMEILNVVLLKEDYSNRSKWVSKISYGLAIVFLIYFTIAKSVVNAHNIIFHYFEMMDVYLKELGSLSLVFSSTLLLLSINLLVPSLILVSKRLNKQQQQIHTKSQDNLVIYTAISLMVLQTLMVPLILLSISYLSFSNWILYIVSAVLPLAISFIFRLNILYKQTLFVIVVCTNIFSIEFFPACMIAASLVQIVRDGKSIVFYLSVIGVSSIVFLNANFGVDITIFHLIITIFSIPAAFIIIPIPNSCLSMEWNEELLLIIQKLSKGQGLTSSQQRQIYTIVHHVYLQKDKYDLSIEQSELKGIYAQLNISSVACLLRNKISLDKAINPNNLLLEIQLSEGEVYTSNFSISLLTKIQAVSQAVEQKGDFLLRLRMMRLIHKLQDQYLLKNQKISPITIIQVEKCIQSFYSKVDQVLSLYLSVWREKTKKCFQKVFIKKIKKLCKAESQCLQLLESINKYKNAQLQNLIYNYILKKFSLSDVDQFCAVKPQRYVEFESNKFILVYDETIVDISQQLAYQIQTNKSFLIGAHILSIIPKDFQYYFKNHINDWLNNHSKDHQIIIPFKSTNSQSVFVPFVCSFKIFAEIEGGIKYLIHIEKGFQGKNEYFLAYSSNEDKITMLSKRFCQQYKNFEQLDKVGQFLFSADQLLGVDLGFLGDYDKQDKQQILCEINLKRFQRRTTQKKINRHYFFNLRLISVYELESGRVFLLSIVPKHESLRNRTINEFIINQSRKLNSYMHKTQEDLRQSQTFCPIKNPLKDIVQQKLNKKNSVFHSSYFLRSVVLSTLLFLLGLGGYLQFAVTLNGQVNSAAGQINQYTLQISKYEKIYLLFFQYYMYIHSLKYPEHYLKVSSTISIAKLQASYASKVVKSVNTIMGMSIGSDAQFKAVPFQLDYGTYQIDLQTDVMALIPVLQDIKYSVSSNEFLFTLQNSEIISLYIESLVPINTNIFQSIINQQYTILIIILSLLLLALLILKVQYINIRWIIWDILDIYDKLSEEQVRQQLSMLNKFKSLLNRTKKSMKAAEPILFNQRRTTVKQTFIAIIIHHNIFLIIVIAAYLVLYYWCFSQIEGYSEQIKDVAAYAAAIQQISKATIHSPQLYYQAAIQELLPPSRRLNITQINQLIIPNLYMSKLPSYFDSFIQQVAEIMKIDICGSPSLIAKINTDLLLGKMNCSKVMFNELSNGFFEAFPFIIGEVNKQTGATLSNIGNKMESTSAYPFFAEVIYARRAMDSIIGLIGSQFKSSVKSYLQDRKGSFDLILIIVVFTLLVVLISICIYLYHMRYLCKITKKSFNLLPRKFIYSLKASKALLRSGLLNKIEMVSN